MTTMLISSTAVCNFLCIHIHNVFTVVDVPELKAFRQHYSGLTRMLFNTNLTPHLIQEGVIALLDQDELNAIPTSVGKASFVLPKVSSALETGETGSFYKILEIMKYHGNHAAQQLSDTIASGIPEPRRGTYLKIYRWCGTLSLN